MEKYFTYMYEDEQGVHYLKSDDETGANAVPVLFGRKINTCCTPGCMVRHEVTDEETVKTTRQTVVCGVFGDSEKIATWAEHERIYKQTKAFKKTAEKLQMGAHIDFFHRIYKSLPNNQRSAFLARVVEQIVK